MSLSSETNDLARVRVGVHVFPNDPYWVQVRAAVMRHLIQLGVTVIPIEILEGDIVLSSVEPGSVAEEICASDLDILVSNDLTDAVAYDILDSGLPVIYLTETMLRHRKLVSPTFLYDVGKLAGEYVAEKLNGQGRVLCVGGLLDAGGDKGLSRITGFYDALKPYPRISVLHSPSLWKYENAFSVVDAQLRSWETAPDAIFGISDPIALAALNAGRSLGKVTDQTLIIGVNGDPLALAAIANGQMTATIETSPEESGRQIAELVLMAATGKSLPTHYQIPLCLVTAQNVFEHGMKKLLEIADLPGQLVGVNRQQENNRLRQLETSMAINRRVGSLLERSQLSQEIANLICTNYGYDVVRLFLWSEHERMLLPYTSNARRGDAIPIESAGLLGEALQRKEPIYISDTRYTHRFPIEAEWAEMRSRVVLPIRLGESILGVLDMHSRQPMSHLRQDLVGLQALADQLGIAMRNAELYADALSARESAETADRLKTRLLANVSHELRTPLNIIMGYSQSALGVPNPYQTELHPALRRDLEYILQSGDHLYRMINDLLDLSRAEIGALDLALEVVEPVALFSQVFESFSHSMAAETITWKLKLPERLPMIHADTMRLRQIVLNLLSNASKFTTQGQITLGADVEPPYLHLWVQDTGAGIPIDQQERIFEPFVTVDRELSRGEGVGLGLTITRRLVALHGGTILLESQPNQGSIFHVYLPLPDLTGNTAQSAADRADRLQIKADEAGQHPVLLLISSNDEVPAELKALAANRCVETCQIPPGTNFDVFFRSVQPIAIAWDIAAAAKQQTTSREWSLIQRLRSHTACTHLPFLVYGAATTQPDDQAASVRLTSVMLKPISARTLSEMLEDICPGEACSSIWIVDDDAEARQYYRRLVSYAFPENEILPAADGAQALDLLAQVRSPAQAPGLVLLDLVMPQVDGFQVIEALRAHPFTQRVPVVVLSGKMLTFEDVQRLDHPQVIFQPKQIIHDEEMQAIFQQIAQGGAALSHPTSTLARHALAYLLQNYAEALSRADVARAVGVTENYLTQIFRQEIGITPWEFLTRLRIQRSGDLLRATENSITSIAADVGFDDPAYFSRVFRKQMGVSPQEYRRSG